MSSSSPTLSSAHQRHQLVSTSSAAGSGLFEYGVDAMVSDECMDTNTVTSGIGAGHDNNNNTNNPNNNNSNNSNNNNNNNDDEEDDDFIIYNILNKLTNSNNGNHCLGKPIAFHLHININY